MQLWQCRETLSGGFLTHPGIGCGNWEVGDVKSSQAAFTCNPADLHQLSRRMVVAFKRLIR